ncbi:uncharacterized protein LOC131003828 [Salvia miltiorrhiza]|uniref:uncharacterized protein LOC131003828 n=1 Tax=Salvia miltiorrhiza TaxID=226208 RepID=UPI0025ACDBA3|nr:uncharacterized protein LOC131003828 [Salvia miltiorrhiza]
MAGCYNQGQSRPYFQNFNQGQQNVNGGWRGQPSSGWVNQNSGGNQYRRPSHMGYQQQQQYFPPQPSVPQQYPQQYQLSPMQQGNFQPQQLQNAQQFEKQVPQQRPSLEETMQSFMEISKENMEMTKQNFESQSATIKRLEAIVGQLSGTLNKIQQQQQPGKFHGQPLQTHQAQAVTVLRSGKMVDNKMDVPVQTKEELPSSAFTREKQPSSAFTRAELPNTTFTRAELPSPVQTRAELPSSTFTREEQPSSAFTRAELPSSAQTRPELPSSALTSPSDGEKAEQHRKPKDGEMEEGKEDKLHKSTTPYRPPIPFPG